MEPASPISTAPSEDIFESELNDLSLRVILFNGQLQFTRMPPEDRVEDLRTFSYHKLAQYSTVISDAFTSAGENEVVELELHYTTVMDNQHWRLICWWEKLKFAGQKHKFAGRPLLDEPFRELLHFLEETHDALDAAGNTGIDLTLPKIPGITLDVSIFKLARIHWSAKHLKLVKPLMWEAELREMLLRKIKDTLTTAAENELRAVDFWYIWGAYRSFDEGVVDAMVAKLADAIDNGVEFADLEVLLNEGGELRMRIQKYKAKKGKLTWAQQLGGSMGSIGTRRGAVPSALSLNNSTLGDSNHGPKTENPIMTSIKLTNGTNGMNGTSSTFDHPPKTASAATFSIMNKDRSESLTSTKIGDGTGNDGRVEAAEADNKKSKGTAYTAPSGMAPPPSFGRGNNRGRKQSHRSGSKRGRGRGDGGWRG
jgi:hypothetical protein